MIESRVSRRSVILVEIVLHDRVADKRFDAWRRWGRRACSFRDLVRTFFFLFYGDIVVI